MLHCMYVFVCVCVCVFTGSSLSISNMEVVKGVELSGAKISVKPRFNLLTSKPDVILTYNKANTGVQLQASANTQKLTVSQTVSENSVITPTVSSSGAISVDWLLRVDQDNTVTTTVTPNDSVAVLWKVNFKKLSFSSKCLVLFCLNNIQNLNDSNKFFSNLFAIVIQT